MSDWKPAGFSVNVINHGGFVEGRYINKDKQASLPASFERPRDLEEITVAELLRRLDEVRKNVFVKS